MQLSYIAMVTPLYYAVKGQHLDAVKLLLEHNANPDMDTLSLAYSNTKNIEITDLLIRYGAKVDYTTTRIILNKHISLIHTMIECGIPMTSRHLYHALEYDIDMYTIKLLLNTGIEVNDSDYPAIHASYNIEYTELLVSYGANINIISHGNTILRRTVCKYTDDEHITIDRLLHVPGIDVNFGNIWTNETPLMTALRRHKIKIAHVLLDHGADPHIQTEKNKISPLHYAVQTSDLSMINRLLELGVSPSICDNDGNQPLHYANNTHAIETLIDTGKVDINAKNKKSMTPIYNAHDVDCAVLLVQHGAILDTVDEQGYTPCKYIQTHRHHPELSLYMMFGSIGRT